MTIRIWNPKNKSMIQNPQLHALSAHTGGIKCFMSMQHFLLSASADKSLIVWKGTKVVVKKTFDSEIRLMVECSESQQFAVYE
jgi:WD40 repeat protein